MKHKLAVCSVFAIFCMPSILTLLALVFFVGFLLTKV